MMKMVMRKYFNLIHLYTIILLLLSFSSYSFKIDRVILATDNNPKYLEFWPLVAKAWKQIVGLRPTLALIATKDVKIDESLGDVIRFEPLVGISTSLQAQVIRWLLPIYFENEVSLVSDIDMIPLSKDYFINSVAHISPDIFVTYRASVTRGQYPMCYNAALGKSFKKLFGLNSINDIPSTIQKWAKLGWGWNTDERILFTYVKNREMTGQKWINLGHPVNRRIDRSNGLQFDISAFQKGHYIDAHLLRPYSQHKEKIDNIIKLLGVRS